MIEMFEHAYAIPDTISERLQIAWRRIEFTRLYTKSLLTDLTDDDWFWTPESVTTHIAWQVGHVAMSAYGLALFRQRGRADCDSELMSGKFRKLFLRGSEPKSDSGLYPPPAEILHVLQTVHQQMRTEMASFDGPSLDDAIEPPHAAYASRYGALLFAADHEMLHAGQIGLLRRLMGRPPLR